jgi:G:T-mismatch repair DNA endonuclease (very short patch repair protein)
MNNIDRVCPVCGRTLSLKNKSGFCTKHRDRSGINNPFYGKKHTQATKDKLVAINKVASVEKWKDPEYRAKVIKAVSKPRREGFKEEQSKRIAKWYKDNPEQKTIRSEHMTKSWREEKISPNNNNFSCNESKLELELFSMLKEVCDVEKITLHNEEGKWFLPDAVAEKEGTIIEFFGDYWHANPSRYNTDDLIKGIPAQSIWDKDEARMQSLRDMGYLVIVVWESEFKADKEGTVSNIDNYLNWESCSF